MESLPENLFESILRPLSLKTKLSLRLVSQRCKWLVESMLQLSLCVFSQSTTPRLPLHARIRLLHSTSNAEEETYETFAFLTSADNLLGGRFDFSYIGQSSHDRLGHEQLSARKPFNDLMTFLQSDDSGIQSFVRVINVDLRKMSLQDQVVLDMIDNALGSGSRKLRLCCPALMPTLPSVCCSQAADSGQQTVQDFSTSLANKHPNFQLVGLCVLSPAAGNADETAELQQYARWMLLNQDHLEELSCSPAWLRAVLHNEEFAMHSKSTWVLSLKRLALNYGEGTAVDEEFLSALGDHFPNLGETTIATKWRQDNAKQLVFPIHTLSNLSRLQKLSITSREAKIALRDLEDNVCFRQLRILCINVVQLPKKDPSFFAHFPALENLTILVRDPFGRQRENHEMIVANLKNRSFRSLQSLTWGTGPGYASNSVLLDTCNAARNCATLSKLTIQSGDCLRQLRALFQEYGRTEGQKTPSFLQLPVKLATVAESASLAKEVFERQNQSGLRNLQLRCIFPHSIKFESKRRLCEAMEELSQQIRGGHYEGEGIAVVDYSRQSREVKETCDSVALEKGEIASITLRWMKLNLPTYGQSPVMYSLKLSF